MAKVSAIQGNFGGGELSPFIYGRVDMDRYRTGLSTCLNYIPTVQGGLVRRPGTQYIGAVKDSTKKVRLLPFKFSATDNFMLEFGHNYIRFYTQYGQVLDASSVPYEVVTNYTEDEVDKINFAQSGDVLYLVHPNHIPRKLKRYGSAQWTISDLSFSQGPFNFTNVDSVISTTSAPVGAATITAVPTLGLTITAIVNNGGKFEITIANGGSPLPASFASRTKLRITYSAGTPSAAGDWDVVYIGNNKFTLTGSVYSGAYVYPASTATAYPQVFSATDVGRRMTLNTIGADPKITRITSVTNSHVAVVYNEEIIGATAFLEGKFQLFWDGSGPAAVSFFEDRLFFTGSSAAAQRVDGSNTGDYENFATKTAGVVTSRNAVSFVLNSADNNASKWLFTDEKGLLSGTSASEWVIKSASTQEALSPTSISAKQSSATGSSDCYPIQAGKAILFVQKSGRKLREFHYFYDVDGFRATDLSVLSEHITQSGLKQLAYQKDPQAIIWAVKNNGGLVGLTYERDIDNVRAGWHRHELGGNGYCESVATIPSPDGTRDDVWLVVKRTINGVSKRYIEYITKVFEDDADQKDAFFVDCGLSYDVPLTITGITLTNPVLVTSVAHGLANGDSVRLSHILGTTQLNDNVYTIAGVTANTFTLTGADGTSMSAYVSGGQVRKRVIAISGLSHLEGQSVQILGDGAVQTSKVVTAGAITLDTRAATVQIGLGYNSDGQMLRLDAGAADGTAIGKTRRVNRVGFMLHRSLNLKIGTSFESLDRMIFRDTEQPLGRAPALFSGIVSDTISSDYDFENQIAWRQDQPLPSTILAILPQMTTQDR